MRFPQLSYPYDDEPLTYRQALVAEQVKFLLVGAYALAAHGYPRATMDIAGVELRIPCVADLIRNKRSTGRTKDLADAEALEQLDAPGSSSP